MDRKKGIVTSTSEELIQVILNNVKKQEAKMREEEVADISQETFKLLYYSDSEDQQRYFCTACKRTEN